MPFFKLLLSIAFFVGWFLMGLQFGVTVETLEKMEKTIRAKFDQIASFRIPNLCRYMLLAYLMFEYGGAAGLRRPRRIIDTVRKGLPTYSMGAIVLGVTLGMGIVGFLMLKRMEYVASHAYLFLLLFFGVPIAVIFILWMLPIMLRMMIFVLRRNSRGVIGKVGWLIFIISSLFNIYFASVDYITFKNTSSVQNASTVKPAPEASGVTGAK